MTQHVSTGSSPGLEIEVPRALKLRSVQKRLQILEEEAVEVSCNFVLLALSLPLFESNFPVESSTGLSDAASGSCMSVDQ